MNGNVNVNEEAGVERRAYDELCGYTLSLRDEAFVHQHVVDAWAAQHADGESKPIYLTFALVGLYLLLERGFTGRQVQRAHMQLAKGRQPWPRFALPRDRGLVTAVDVFAAPEGAEREKAIRAWCASVWAAFAASRDAVAELLRKHGIV